jgi:branched-chain amino acid transport system permease protein
MNCGKAVIRMEQFIANGLCRGSIFAMVALGFGLIYTTSGVFHIAHGFIYTAAAYALYWAGAFLKAPLAFSVLVALASTVALAVLIETLVYRPLDRRKASSTVLLISSFGVYIVGVNLLAMMFGNETKILRAGVEGTFRLGNVVLTYIQILQLACGLVVVVAYWLFLRRTAIGRISRAVADDPVLASVLGVPVEGVRILAFSIGSILAAIGAILIALDVGMDPHVGMPMVLSAAVACLIGGLHRFIAPALGGILLGLIQSLVIWQTSARWESAITFTILIGFLLFRPQGLLGVRQRLEET